MNAVLRMTNNQRQVDPQIHADAAREIDERLGWKFLAWRHRKSFGDAVWLIIASGATVVGTLAGNRLITEYAAPNVFGQISLLLAVVSFLRMLVFYPVGQSAYRFYADVALTSEVGLLRQEVKFLLSMAVSIMVMGLLAIGLAWSLLVGTHYLLFIMLAAFFALEVFRSMECILLQAARRQRTYAIFRVLEQLLIPSSVVGCILLFGATPTVLLGGQLFASVLLLGLFLALVEREGIRSPAGSRLEQRRLREDLLRFALPLVPLVVIGKITNVGDRFILGGLLSVSDLGIYVAMYGLASQPFIMANGIIDKIIAPSYFRTVARDDHDAEKKILRCRLWVTIGICLAGWILLCMFKEVLVRYLVGREYRVGSVLIPWIALGYAINAVSQVYQSRCRAYKQTRLELTIESSGAVASVITEFAMIPLLGLSGAAMAIPAYFGVQLLTGIWLSGRCVRSKSVPRRCGNNHRLSLAVGCTPRTCCKDIRNYDRRQG